MAGSVDADMRPDKAVVANGNESLVKHGEAEIGKETLANPHVLAVIAIKRLVDEDVFVADASKQSLEHFKALLALRRQQGIVTMNDVFNLVEFTKQLFVCG